MLFDKESQLTNHTDHRADIEITVKFRESLAVQLQLLLYQKIEISSKQKSFDRTHDAFFQNKSLAWNKIKAWALGNSFGFVLFCHFIFFAFFNHKILYIEISFTILSR